MKQKIMKDSRLLVFLFACAEFLVSQTGYAQNSIRFSGFAADGYENTVPRTGNRNGLIVGRVETKTSQHGMIYNGKEFVIYDVPRAVSTQGYGINDAGVTVGLYYDSANHYHGYLRNANGSFSTIDYPGAVNTTAGEINNAGQIIGHFQDVSGKLIGYICDKEIFTSIEIPGASQTIPYGINDKGLVAGWYKQGNRVGSFLYHTQSKKITYIKDIAGAKATAVWGINDAGQMAGFTNGDINDTTGRHHGFIIDKGKPTVFDLGTEGETVVFGIDDKGQLIGFYNHKGFLLEIADLQWNATKTSYKKP